MTATHGQTTNESSVQFSLSELQKLEVERQQEHARREKLREERRREAELEAAQAVAAKEAERARLRQAEELRSREAELLAQAKAEALQKAAVEQARITVEAEARMKERDRERAHEIERARIMADAAKSNSSISSLIGGTLLGGLVTLLVMTAVYFGVTKPAAERHVAELESKISELDQRVERADQRVEEEGRVISQLTRERDEARAGVGASEGTARKVATPAKPPPNVKVPPSGRRTEDKPSEPCPPRDPMCFSLPR